MSSTPSPPARSNSESIPHSRQSPRITENMAQSAGIPQRLRNDESWVEISSQPSSSSLSSIGDEIVTTGLRVHHDFNTRRRRRVPGVPSHIPVPLRQTGTSSQEEYEESESEEDRVMTSSNEHILPPPRVSISRPTYDAGSESDDDENATALGRRTSSATTAFTPQPNAFSHPPSSHTHRAPSYGSYFPPQQPPRSERPNYNSRTSSHAADHDAALRASLTTLLSIGAAAARSLPKREGGGIGSTTIQSTEPMGLRFIPESELNNPTIPANSGRPLTPSTRARSSPSISSQDAIEQGKRKAASVKPSGEKSRPSKKKKVQTMDGEALLSPTLMAWFMSAGVVVLVSVVGFGAGYVIGREVGRQEVLAGFNGSSLADGGSCGKEAIRGTASLRRFRWNLGGGARGVVA